MVKLGWVRISLFDKLDLDTQRQRRHRRWFPRQVSRLRQALTKTLDADAVAVGGALVLAEVVNHHVARVLDDQLLLRHLKVHLIVPFFL